MSTIGTLSNLLETDISLSVVWTITDEFFNLSTGDFKLSKGDFISPVFSGVNKNVKLRLNFPRCESLADERSSEVVQNPFFPFFSPSVLRPRLHCENSTGKIVGILCTLKFIKSGNISELQLVGSSLFKSNDPSYSNFAQLSACYCSTFEKHIENGMIKIKVNLDFFRPGLQQGINRDQATCTDDTYDHNICQNNYSTISPANVLDTLFTSEKFSDFVIKVEGQEIAVHKCILASRSSVFCAMLENNFSESNLGYLEITDIDKDTTFSFVRYLYTSKVTISNVDFAKKLFVVADKYDVPDLKLVCEKYICGNINASNVVDILMFADLHNAGDIKAKASDFAVDHFKEINHAQFDILGEQTPHLMISLMKKLSLK